MQEVKRYTYEVVAKQVARPASSAATLVAMPAYDLGDCPCPKCKQGKLLKGKRAFGCSRFKEGCDFTIRPLIAGKMVEQNHLVDLLTHGHTSGWVQGFTNKAGKRFDARLRLQEDFAVTFEFGGEMPAKAPTS
jgi:DNA topoisomerase-3